MIEEVKAKCGSDYANVIASTIGTSASTRND